MTLLERVARAMFAQRMKSNAWDVMASVVQDAWRESARAALSETA